MRRRLLVGLYLTKEYMKIHKETIFHRWWKCNDIKGLRVVRHEFPLKDARKILQRETQQEMYNTGDDVRTGVSIGRIDVIFYKASRMYIGEIKYMSNPNDFWDATKVLGYCEYFKWQTDMKHALPAIIMPISSIKLEHKIVANRLKIRIFGIEEIESGFSLKDMS